MPIHTLHNEPELLQRIADGDETAFRQLVKEYSGLLYNFLNSHLKNHESAQEIMQDIFIQIWQTRESLSAIRNLRTFLFVLSRNYAINEINKLIRKKINEKKYLNQQTDSYTEPSDTDEHCRRPWGIKSGGKGSGLFKTTDGGKHWKQLNEDNGLPAGELGRIGIAIAQSNPKVVYTLIEGKRKAGLYKSMDGGTHWEYLKNEHLTSSAWYFSEI